MAVVSDDCGFRLSLPCAKPPLSVTSSQEPDGLKLFATVEVATFTLLIEMVPRVLSKLQMLLDLKFFGS